MEIDFSTLTWAMIVAIFKRPDLYIYFWIVVAGTVAHFIKETKIDGKADGSIKKYWMTSKKASLMSIFGSLCGFVYLYHSNSHDVVAYFGMGFMSDSFFNRAQSMMAMGGSIAYQSPYEVSPYTTDPYPHGPASDTPDDGIVRG